MMTIINNGTIVFYRVPGKIDTKRATLALSSESYETGRRDRDDSS